MDDMARAEYPAMLVSCNQGFLAAPQIYVRSQADVRCAIEQATLQPGQAVHILTDRVKRINRINTEIADWLQVRIPEEAREG